MRRKRIVKPAQGGMILVVSAPSGSGKSTLIRRLLARDRRLKFSVSYTTRAPRAGERNGRDYFYVSRKRFKRMIAAGEFVEWADVYGNFYGTARRQVARALASGRDILLDIDVQGHRQVKRRLPETASIFILPPSYRELEKRLRRRHLDAPETIRKRLAVAKGEMRHWREYDFLVVNDTVAKATARVRAIVEAARLGRAAQRRQAEKIFKTFGG